jgi:hypothetical protein
VSSDLDLELVWRVVDHGRACPTLVGSVGEEERIVSGVTATGLRWAVVGAEVPSPHVQVFEVDLSGRVGRGHPGTHVSRWQHASDRGDGRALLLLREQSKLSARTVKTQRPATPVCCGALAV